MIKQVISTKCDESWAGRCTWWDESTKEKVATYCGAKEGAGQPELSREKELVKGGGCSRRGKGPNEGLEARKPGLAGDSEVFYGWTTECGGDQQDEAR